MSISTNAEESDANQSKFYRVTSSEPVTDADALFDILSNFLMKDKRRQIAMEYLDEKDLISSRLTWNNLRNVANFVLNESSLQRDPVPAWIDQKEAIVVDDINETPRSDTKVPSKEDNGMKVSPDVSPESTAAISANTKSNVDITQNTTNDGKRAAKIAKKAAKEARKRERAEKREAKKARKEAREAKKLEKAAKKRKREEQEDD